MEKVIRVNGVDLCVDTFGEPADRAILLIGGATSSMDWWEDDFCRRLAEGDASGGRFVIRYDPRDTGRSVAYPQGEPGYTVADLTDDALGVLDALGVVRAHLVGVSMGGGIVQTIGVLHPERTASLTLMSTSPGGSSGPGELPPPTERVRRSFSEPAPQPDWSDREEVIEYILGGLRVFAGGLGVDEPRSRAIIGRVYDRTTDIAAAQTNHWLAAGGGEPVHDRLGEIAVPVLVVHGSDDPLFPPAHAHALAEEIPGARLLILDGAGHEMPPEPTWDLLVPALLEHTSTTP